MTNTQATRNSRPLSAPVRVDGRARRTGWIVFAAVGLAVIAPLVGFMAWKQRQAGAAAEAYWSLSGSPCPALDQAAFEARPRKPMSFTFEGVGFARGAGHMECTRRVYDQADGRREAPVCDFGGPIVLAVSVGGRQTFYAPPGSARVAVIDGRARCVQRPWTRIGR